MVGGNAVFERVWAAAVFGDVAAEGADGLAAGVRGEVEAEVCHSLTDCEVRAAGLCKKKAVLCIYLQDLAHSCGCYYDATSHWEGASAQAGAGSARGEGDVVLVADADDCSDFFGGFREDDVVGVLAMDGVGVAVVRAFGGVAG